MGSNIADFIIREEFGIVFLLLLAFIIAKEFLVKSFRTRVAITSIFILATFSIAIAYTRLLMAPIG